MKKNTLTAGLLFLIGMVSGTSEAIEITAKIKSDTVKRVGELMRANYVYADKGDETAKFLEKKLKSGGFNKVSNDEEFAKQLTDAIREVTKDKHLRVITNQSGGRHHSEDDAIEERIKRKESSRFRNGGVAQVRKLEGNIGYLELRGFHRLHQAKPKIDAAMSLLTTSDALIIDLRKNGGGSPATVQYLCSYFFDKRTHLNSLYWRDGDVTNEFWTLDDVGGSKLPEIPLYVLTSDRTFSGAEEFSYNMQTRERATLVGQTTGGGANPGGMFRINDHFGMFVATGRAINPVTGISWEGTGVVPEVKVDSDNALEEATKFALKAAKKLRDRARKIEKDSLTKLNALLNKANEEMIKVKPESVQGKFNDAMSEINKTLAMDEDQINELGYQYLMQKKMPKVATLIMQFNVDSHPDSINAYDSLGDALLGMNNPIKAKKSFEKGLSLITGDNPQIRNTLEQNLARADKLITELDN